MGRPPCCDATGVKKGPWTAEEDKKLVEYMQKRGRVSWRGIPAAAGLNRCGKSCRLRWTNYLRPDIKRGKFTDDEDRLIIHLHSILGNKWSTIATHLQGRTDNEIKNYWNTHVRKKLLRMGIDPVTHQRRDDFGATLVASSSLPAFFSAAANLKDLDTSLKQLEVLPQLVHAMISSTSTMASMAASAALNAIFSSSYTVPNFQIMSCLSHANQTEPGYLCTPNVTTEQEMVQQMNSLGAYAAPTAHSSGSLVSISSQELVSTTHVKEFAGSCPLTPPEGPEPMEAPNLLWSQEVPDLNWKEILEEISWPCTL